MRFIIAVVAISAPQTSNIPSDIPCMSLFLPLHQPYFWALKVFLLLPQEQRFLSCFFSQTQWDFTSALRVIVSVVRRPSLPHPQMKDCVPFRGRRKKGTGLNNEGHFLKMLTSCFPVPCGVCGERSTNTPYI